MPLPPRLAILFFLGVVGAIVPARAEEFVPGTEDIPLMPGLAPVANSALVFDKPEGRIVETRVAGATTRAKVEAFYAASLPPLGWTPLGRDRWRRDAERLTLDFSEARGGLAVGFTLSPN
jgi:hypothetical protein